MKSESDLHLPVDLHSPDQLSGALVTLQRYRGELRDATVRARAGGKDTKPAVSELLEGLLTSNGVAADNGDALDTLHTKLEKILKTAPVIRIMLAAPAPRTLKRQLTVWFRSQVHPTCLLTFSAKSDMGGGVILHAGSRIYDYSFRAAILDNKKRVMELAGV